VNKLLLPLLSVGLLVSTACGDGDSEPVAVEQPWARATVEAQPHGAAYFELTVDHDDVLTGASVPASIADHAEIHEIVEVEPGDDGMAMGDDATDTTTDMGEASGDEVMGGMAPGMSMRELIDGLPLRADETVTLEPGGYHVMLLDLVDPLEVGEEFELTLSFAEGDDVTVAVPVLETAP
jgi:copper(I)-binding protein